MTYYATEKERGEPIEFFTQGEYFFDAENRSGKERR
jgi:hypothetical protein